MSSQTRIITATHARANLYRLMETVAREHKPTLITGKHTNAILISEKDWDDIAETIYLSSMPEVTKSIIEGMNTPPEQCSKRLDW